MYVAFHPHIRWTLTHQPPKPPINQWSKTIWLPIRNILKSLHFFLDPLVIRNIISHETPGHTQWLLVIGTFPLTKDHGLKEYSQTPPPPPSDLFLVPGHDKKFNTICMRRRPRSSIIGNIPITRGHEYSHLTIGCLAAQWSWPFS